MTDAAKMPNPLEKLAALVEGMSPCTSEGGIWLQQRPDDRWRQNENDKTVGVLLNCAPLMLSVLEDVRELMESPGAALCVKLRNKSWPALEAKIKECCDAE